MGREEEGWAGGRVEEDIGVHSAERRERKIWELG